MCHLIPACLLVSEQKWSETRVCHYFFLRISDCAKKLPYSESNVQIKHSSSPTACTCCSTTTMAFLLMLATLTSILGKRIWKPGGNRITHGTFRTKLLTRLFWFGHSA